jgi:F0F1-type ATP synthase epsilon subunit
MKDSLTVKFFTVDRQLPPLECDSVRIPVADSSKGEFSGSYGIKKGHARAVFALKQGTVIVAKDGKTILTANISDGFAIVEDNEISITVDSIEE